MTKVISLASRQAGRNPQATAFPLTPERQAVIEKALTMALHFVRQPGALPANLWAATSRSTRAATLLKQCCEGTGSDDRPATPVRAHSALQRCGAGVASITAQGRA